MDEMQNATERFLSTPSGWRATPPPQTLIRPCQISIHALRVEGDVFGICPHLSNFISIHALRVEGDKTNPNGGNQNDISIHALRVEGDGTAGFYDTLPDISIHALRVEGDSFIFSLP